MAAVEGRARPVDRTGGVEFPAASGVARRRRRPAANRAPRREDVSPPPEPYPYSWDRSAQAIAVWSTVQDRVEHQPIGDRLAAWVAASARAHRDQRLQLGPQVVVDLKARDGSSMTSDPRQHPDGFEVKGP